MESKLVVSCRMMHNLIKLHPAVKSYGQFHWLTKGGEQMDGWAHAALGAHLRLVRQYCLNTCFTGTDESECYERKDSNTSGN